MCDLAELSVQRFDHARVGAQHDTRFADAIHQAIGEPRVVLRANPRVIEALNGQLSEIAHEEGYEGRLVAAADPAINGADCRIEWRGGGAERSEAAMEEALATM